MKKFISALLAVVFICFTGGCFGPKENKSLNVYFKNQTSTNLVYEEVKYSGSQNIVDMANFAINKLIEGPEKANLLKTLPDGVKLLSLAVKDSTANIDFSAQFTSYSGIDELLARFSVVRTLCDIPGISKVSITVEGRPLVSDSTGNEIGILSKKDVISDSDVLDAGKETTSVTLYFSTGDASTLKPEVRKVETQYTTSIERTIVSELIKGPTSPELDSVMPEGTKILNIETKDGVCYVNLSQDFISKFVGGTGMLEVYSIVNSLCGLESVTSVQILIDGEKGAEFGNFVFDEPLTPNLNIVQQ